MTTFNIPNRYVHLKPKVAVTEELRTLYNTGQYTYEKLAEKLTDKHPKKIKISKDAVWRIVNSDSDNNDIDPPGLRILNDVGLALFGELEMPASSLHGKYSRAMFQHLEGRYLVVRTDKDDPDILKVGSAYIEWSSLLNCYWCLTFTDSRVQDPDLKYTFLEQIHYSHLTKNITILTRWAGAIRSASLYEHRYREGEGFALIGTSNFQIQQGERYRTAVGPIVFDHQDNDKLNPEICREAIGTICQKQADRYNHFRALLKEANNQIVPLWPSEN